MPGDTQNNDRTVYNPRNPWHVFGLTGATWAGCLAAAAGGHGQRP